MKTYVYCKTRFIGLHCWDDAPPDVGYLRAVHRHEFHVTLAVEVEHDNRDVEFITMRKQLDKYLRDHREWDLGLSCEMMANNIEKYMREQYNYKVSWVEVSEDGENGAVIVC